MSSVIRETSNNHICQPIYISTSKFYDFSRMCSMRLFVLLFFYWLKATDTYTAIEKYPIDQTTFFQP